VIGKCMKINTNYPNNRPSECTNNWIYQGKPYGPSGYIPPQPKQNCFMGLNEKQPMKNEYGTFGCNLYNYYNACIQCEKKNKCLVYYVDGTVNCEDCKNGKKPNCLSSPTDGFGCPGESYIEDNMAPIDPSIHSGVVCAYPEK
jgi:hypothetical protein